MASLHAPEEEDIQIDPAEPLKGIVVCCTSIPAEHRVSYRSALSHLHHVFY
jgi:hypothetical protein